MSDELVDIVDSNNAIVGQAMKSEAHEKGLLHRCVVAMIRRSDGAWLLVRQSSDRQDAGQYVAPVGGHVQAGEHQDDALKREAAEEVGFDRNFKFRFVGSGIFDRHILGRHENHLFLMYEIDSDTEPQLNHQSESYRYFAEDELKRLLREEPKMFGDACHFGIGACFPQLLPEY
jgi:isopentenyl-diphosphate delta-isomerase